VENELLDVLLWYLEDDMRSFEQGILEAVSDRPAYAVLEKHAALQSFAPDRLPRCPMCGKPMKDKMSCPEHFPL